MDIDYEVVSTKKLHDKYKIKMKRYQLFVGIDVSKLTLSVCIGLSPLDYKVYETTNDAKGMKAIIAWILSYQVELNQILLCFEHTGTCTSLLKYTFASDYLGSV